MKRNVLIGALVIICIFTYFRQKKKNYYDLINAVSGATPLAVARDVPDNCSLVVDGLLKKEYRFSCSALNGFASTRIRTLERTQDGSFQGAYIYVGIPVFNILEGVAPQKPENSTFNQPVDMIVDFTSASGNSVYFSYNEIIMSDDSLPVTLAYYRQPIEPATEKVRATYQKNLFTDDLQGLRLIAPREPDISRYLDNVVRITCTVLPAPDDLLPPRTKGVKCVSNTLHCINGSEQQVADLEHVSRNKINRWVMVAHGYGYDKTVTVTGYDLRSFLTVNFPDANISDFYLFVSCDGYRCLFSGREIFATDVGTTFMIADTMDGQPMEYGYRLAQTGDFFMDRSMWGLAYIAMLTGPEKRYVASE